MYEGDFSIKELTNDKELRTYVGTKILLAKPMTEFDYLKSQGKEISPLRETEGDGYLVIYDNGYKSWSPKNVFEAHYRLVTDSEKSIVK